MGILFVVLGVLATASGLLMVAFGIPVREFSFGNTLIVAGTIASVGGLVVAGVGFAISQLRRIAEAVQSRPAIRTADLPDVIPTSRNTPTPGIPVARVPFPPKARGEGAAPSDMPAMQPQQMQPPQMPSSATRDLEDQLSSFAPMREEPPVPPELDDVRPPVSGMPPPPFPPRPMPTSPSAMAQRGPGRAPQASEPRFNPFEDMAEPNFTPAPPPNADIEPRMNTPRPQMNPQPEPRFAPMPQRQDSILEDLLRQDPLHNAQRQDSLRQDSSRQDPSRQDFSRQEAQSQNETVGREPPRNEPPRADFREPAPRPPRPAQKGFDSMWGNDRPSMAPPARPEPPRSDFQPPPPPPAAPSMSPSMSPSVPPLAPASEPPAPEAAPAAPARNEQRAVPILKSGVVDGMGYTLYVDGSIEAELPQGNVRFSSIADLRAHLEKNS